MNFPKRWHKNVILSKFFIFISAADFFDQVLELIFNYSFCSFMGNTVKTRKCASTLVCEHKPKKTWINWYRKVFFKKSNNQKQSGMVPSLTWKKHWNLPNSFELGRSYPRLCSVFYDRYFELVHHRYENSTYISPSTLYFRPSRYIQTST